MKIYIANTSRQHWMFNFSHPNMRPINAHITSGHQSEVTTIDNQAHMDKVIETLRRFGAISRDELSLRPGKFEGLVFSLDKPMQENHFQYGNEVVLDQAESRAVVEATKAALASDVIVNPRGRERMTGPTEAEFEEEIPMRGKPQKKMKIAVDPSVSRGDKLPLR